MIRPQASLGLLTLGLLLAPALPRAEEIDRVVFPGESRPAASRLDEARKRLADRKWDQGIALLQTVIDSSANDLVPLGKGRTVSARRLAHAILARGGPPCLAMYRKRSDSQAQRWLDGAAGGEEGLYRRIAEEAFCSTQARKALDRLGDLAFERGRLAEAENWWHLLAPLEAVGAGQAPLDELAYPDPPADLAARVRAKQLLSRLHRGAAGWQVQLDAFRKRHPGAVGALAGREGVYGDVLTAVARERAQAPPGPAVGDWTTFGGSPTRDSLVPGPQRLADTLGQLCRAGPAWRFDLARRQGLAEALPEVEDQRAVSAARRMAFYPVVVGGTALVADARYITAYDLKTGKAAEWYDAARFRGGLKPRLELPAAPDLRYSLTVGEGCVFARMGTQAVRDVRPDPRAPRQPVEFITDKGESALVSLSLEPGPDGDRRRWSVWAVDPGRKEYAIFEGAPVVVDGRVFIAATRFVGDRVVTAIHCYPAHPEDTTSPLLWKTDVCETRELLPASAAGLDAARSRRTRHHLLTVAGRHVVYCSHSGAVVAVDGRSGNRAWAVRYPRRDEREPEDEPGLGDLAPCVFADGRLYVAPNDSNRLLCLDPATGETLWHRDGLDVVHLVGVGSGRLIFSTWRSPEQGKLFAGGLRAIDAVDGGDGPGWTLPDDGGGLVPLGRGLLVGDLVLWPTARRPYGVFAVRQEDGMQTDNPALLHRIPSGNLTFANGCLLVADQQTLWAFVPPAWRPAADRDEQVRLRRAARPEGARPADELAQSVRAGRWRHVLQRPPLRPLSIQDERGVPRSAVAVAREELARPTADGTRPADREVLAFHDATPPVSRPHLLRQLLTLYPDSPAARRLATAAAEAGEKAGQLDLAAVLWLRLVGVTKGDERAVALRGLGRCWEGRGYRTAARALWRRPGPEQGELDAPPVVSLPLDTTCQIGLSPGEVILPGHAAEGPARDCLWSVRGTEITCRGRSDGGLRWRRELQVDHPWAVLLGPVLVVGDARGLFAFDAVSGGEIWARTAPPAARHPATRSGAHRVVVEAEGSSLGEAILCGTRLVIMRDRRSLLAIDALTGDSLWQRPAPGAAFTLPFPRGSIAHLARAGDDRVIAQASGRRWLLDVTTGAILEQSATGLAPWAWRPVGLGGGLLAVPSEGKQIDVLDVNKGKLRWSRRQGGTTLPTGEGPRVVPAGARTLFLEPMNVGVRLTCLDRATGAMVGPGPVLVEGGGALAPEGWVASSDAVYHTAEGEVSRRSLPDGGLVWTVPFPGAERARLVLAGRALLIVPGDRPGSGFRLRWPLGSVQWEGGTVPHPQGAVCCLDAGGGEVVQRVHLDVEALPARWAVDRSDGRLLPALEVTAPRRAGGTGLMLDEAGLVVGQGNQVKVLRPRAPSGK